MLRPGRFTPRKETWYPLYRGLVGPQGCSGRLQKISPLPGFDSRTVQPVATLSRLTVERQLSIAYSEFVTLALVIQHGTRMRHIVICGLSGCTILSSVACLAVPYCHLWPVWLYHTVICGLSGCTMLSHVACLAVPYCHLWSVWLYHIVTCGLSSCTIWSPVVCLAVHFVTCGLSSCTILSSVACLAVPYCQLWSV
jgi:hypothetical protein